MVRFNDLDEFLAELKLDAEHIDRKLIRLTIRQEFRDPFVHTSVVCTFQVGSQTVRLDARCGSYFTVDSDGHKTAMQKAKGFMDRIEAAAREVGQEVRAGIIE